MHLITGYSGSAHITSANDGEVNAHVFGSGKYVFDSRNKFSAEIVSNNVININSGEGLFNGRYFEIVSGSHDVANIDNGSSGTNRIDLIVARYTKNSETGVEAMAITVIKGTAASSPVVPSYNTGNILDGVGIADFPLYKVTIEGLTITKCESMFSVRNDILTDITSGKITAKNATTATKLGSSTVGNSGKPIYLNNGVATACNVDTSMIEGSTNLVTSSAIADEITRVQTATTPTMKTASLKITSNFGDDGTYTVDIPISNTNKIVGIRGVYNSNNALIKHFKITSNGVQVLVYNDVSRTAIAVGTTYVQYSTL